MTNSPPMDGFQGGLTHAAATGVQPAPQYEFLRSTTAGLSLADYPDSFNQPAYVLNSGYLPTVRSSAVWLTGAEARMPSGIA